MEEAAILFAAMRIQLCFFLCITLNFSTPCQFAAFSQSSNPSPTLQSQADQFSIFELVTILELSVFGRSHPKTVLEERLQAIEINVFGKGNIHSGDVLSGRVKALFEAVEPPNDLLEDVARDAATNANWSLAKASTGEWLSTSFQIVSTLEIEVVGKLSLEELLIDRVAALEKILLPPDQQNLDQLSLARRIDQLLAAMLPNPSKWQIARKKAGLGSNDIALLSSIGQGTKKVKKGVGKVIGPGRQVLQSPTFWMILLGSAALVGAVYATRSSGDGSDPEYGCHGEMNCTICKNCRRCFHCNEGKAPCGVLIKKRMGRL